MTANIFGDGYRHTQRGTLILAVTLGPGMVFIGLAVAEAQLHQLWLGGAMLLVIAWLFSSLTIEITDRELRWRFGPGLIRKSVPLAEIATAAPVRTTFLQGWGIHLTGRGWLYNVSGFDAVAVTLRSGKRFLLGTDEPQVLMERLEEVIRRQAPAQACR